MEDLSHRLVEKVPASEIDADILALPYSIEGLISFNFWQEGFYWVCHKDQCPKKVQGITSEALEIDKLMLLKEGHCLKGHAIAAYRLQPSHKKQDTDVDSASPHTLIQMIAGKLGTTLLPQIALEPLTLNESELRAIHVNEPGPHRTIVLIIRLNYVRTNELTLLKDIFTKQLTNKYS
ncbi:LysR substrate-binding domain-containing protein [Colwellia sp. BRX8-9]|uniref:LysR substrate-binding domain-containing protein n=1 Tax=Colwellia sp. BRX8-9 TaxID=2759831 RepID=UPI0028739814|nr:LysR substrate-binding domain-containing protein [Colwellia sp. BRX8-9]